MARKPETDHPPLPSPDYSFPAMPRAAADRSGADEFLALMEQYANQRAIGAGPPRGQRLGRPGGVVLP